jgi:peptidoglycan/xylan/chitin deacetylase (PgdA/CDA1 family)
MRQVSLLFHDVYAADPRESGFVSPAADRYKLSVEDVDAQLKALGQCGAGLDGPRRGPQGSAPHQDFQITVDDGGVSYYTQLADRLEARGWRGHCFVSTDFISHRGFLTAGQLRELDARGHVIGSHSATHPARFSALAFDEMHVEWICSRRALEDLLGHAVTVASVPGGYYSRQVAQSARDAGIERLFTSEPITTVRDVDGCLVAGRFTIRQGHAPDLAARLAGPAPWARAAEWARWNAKGLVKPLLGPSYGRVADWVLGEHHG